MQNRAFMNLYSLNIFRYDPAGMKTHSCQAQWASRPLANLARSVPSGRYFARARVRGKLIRRSLQTDVLLLSPSVASAPSGSPIRNSQLEIRHGGWREWRGVKPRRPLRRVCRASCPELPKHHPLKGPEPTTAKDCAFLPGPALLWVGRDGHNDGHQKKDNHGNIHYRGLAG